MQKGLSVGLQEVTEHAQLLLVPGLLAPEQADAAPWLRVGEGADGDAVELGGLGWYGQLGDECDPETTGHHFYERVEAGGLDDVIGEGLILTTDLECLIAQAVSVFQEQEGKADQVLDADLLFWGEGMIGRQGDEEAFLKEFSGEDAGRLNGQGEEQDIELALFQLA